MATQSLRELRLLVSVSAISAPVLHSLTDLMEWYQRGFSEAQLWLNYLAFLPMPWLLLGVYAVHNRDLGFPALFGALLHGIAFTYFAHTTLLALDSHVPTYDALWQQLGMEYTFYGALMICGGLLFSTRALCVGGLPKIWLSLFSLGLLLNLILAFLPVPDVFQTLGTAIRNTGLVGVGYSIWRSTVPDLPTETGASRRQMDLK
ncbi:MAG: hypothetical protein KDD44_10350 [Bdellovibrionales bacterium]|nr:hypothetical protein [Bdellovibrionales bacterium]